MGGGGGGSSGKKGGAPNAPNFSKLAMVNQSNPMGGASWFTDPATGQIMSKQQFSGQAGNTFQGLLGGMESASQMDPAQAGQAAFDKVYGSFASRLDPRWDALRQGFDTKMANSGAVPGETAYNNANREFGVRENDAYNDAIGRAVQLGQGEQQQSRANAAMPFSLAETMMGFLPKNDTSMPLKAGMAQYDAAMNSQEAQNSKKGTGLSGLGNIAGSVFGGPMGGMLGGAAGGLLGNGLSGIGSSTPGDYSAQILPPGYDPNWGANL